MSNEVESMFSARELPWHGLGTVTSDVLTAADAITTAGLDWSVGLEDMFLQSGTKVPDRHAVVRDRDSKVLGTVGGRYEPFQNLDAFTFCDNLVDSGAAKYETAGSLRGGRVIFVTMKVPHDMLIGGSDPHNMYLLLRTSHDGSTAIGVYVTIIRVVCMNTLSLAIRGAKHRWAVPHVSTAKAKIAEARDTLALSFKYGDAFQKEAEELLKVKVTEKTAQQMYASILPARPKTDEIIIDIMQLLKESKTIDDGYRKTGWGVLNAFSEYFEHGRETRSIEARAYAVLDGHGARMRNNLAALIHS